MEGGNSRSESCFNINLLSERFQMWGNLGAMGQARHESVSTFTCFSKRVPLIYQTVPMLQFSPNVERTTTVIAQVQKTIAIILSKASFLMTIFSLSF